MKRKGNWTVDTVVATIVEVAAAIMGVAVMGGLVSIFILMVGSCM